MKILYDHQAFMQKYGGISRYFSEIMTQYSLDSNIDFALSIRFSDNENLLSRDILNKYWSKKNNFGFMMDFFSRIQKISHLNMLDHLRINQIESVRMLKKQNCDIFHPTYYDPYFLKYIEKKPFVLTVYDMIHELYPEFFSENDSVKKWKKKLIENANSIISISENTKKDILELYDIEESKINVVYLGNPLENVIHYEPVKLELDKQQFLGDYLLFVGNRSGYKNFKYFINSIGKYLNAKNLNIVCAGGGAFTSEELLLFKKLNLHSRIHYAEINDSVLKKLYENAQAFIFPSLYEGFGLPVLEAFSCGCPVILSDFSSFPEVGGDAACYIDPNSLKSILQGVECVCSDENYRKNLIRKGFKQLKKFSWEKTAIETKKVYEELL